MDDEPTYDIAIVRVSGQMAIDEKRLVEVIRATLQRHAAPRTTLTVALVDDPEIARLNERHLNLTGPTDVLAFDLDGDASGGDVPRKAINGEIVLSVDTAAREARRRGHDGTAEVALYAVHGTLHLLGYDDRNEVDAARMHAVEDEVLASVGLGAVYGAGPG